MRTVTETPLERGGFPLLAHPEWAARFPWLVQGTTGRAAGDLGLFGAQPVGEVLGRWRRLRESVGLARAAHARQVHAARVLSHGPGAPGLLVADGYDGHATREPSLLLTVSVADCVPVSVVDAETRAVAVLHGGWRGVAAGILESGLEALGRLAGSRPGSLWIHCGPAICGRCYEVGPEVHEALGLPVPAANAPVDLRAVLVERALRLGVPGAQLSVSSHCTRCSEGLFFSHRAGSPGRQMGLLGVAGAGEAGAP